MPTLYGNLENGVRGTRAFKEARPFLLHLLKMAACGLAATCEHSIIGLYIWMGLPKVAESAMDAALIWNLSILLLIFTVELLLDGCFYLKAKWVRKLNEGSSPSNMDG